MIIDRRLLAAAAFLAAASLGSLCGLIHSPLASGGLFWPGGSGSAWPGLLAGGYGLLAGLLVLLAPWAEAGERDQRRSGPAPESGDARLTPVRLGVTQKSMLVNSVTLPRSQARHERRLPWHVV